jgi:hypothetical protein
MVVGRIGMRRDDPLKRHRAGFLMNCPAMPDRVIAVMQGRACIRRSSYAVLWNAFKRLAAGYSADEKVKLLAAWQSASTVSPRSQWLLRRIGLKPRFAPKLDPVERGGCRARESLWQPRLAPRGKERTNVDRRRTDSPLGKGHGLRTIARNPIQPSRR